MHGTFERGEPPRRRGTKLAPELDRRLGTNEDLVDVIEWWHEAWRAALRLSLTFHRTEDCQPKNFSDNELAVFVLVMTSGCGIDNRGTELHWLWSMLGFDCAKMSDPGYAETVQDKYWTRLEAFREAQRN
jgi:hypothetical protein